MDTTGLNNNGDGTGREEECTGLTAGAMLKEMDSTCHYCSDLQAKLEHTEQALKNAKKAAREGLLDMAEQNAKLVAAYVDKKREVKQLQAAAKEDRRLWQQRLQRLEHELQANKLHIQALMQQLHALASKHALGAEAGSPTTPVSRSTASSSQHCTTGVDAAGGCSSPAASCSSGSFSSGVHTRSSCYFTAGGSSGISPTPQNRAAKDSACSPLGDATNTYSKRPTPISKLQPLKQHNSRGSTGTQARSKPEGCNTASDDQENCHFGSSAPSQVRAATAAAAAGATQQRRPQPSTLQSSTDTNRMQSKHAVGLHQMASQQYAEPFEQQQTAESPKQQLKQQQQQQQGDCSVKPQDPHARIGERLQQSLSSLAASAAAQAAPATQQPPQQQQNVQQQQAPRVEQQQQEAEQMQLLQEEQQQRQPGQEKAEKQQQQEQQRQQEQKKAVKQHQQEQEQQLAQLALRAQQLEAENAKLREAQAEADALRAKVQRLQEAEQLKQRGNALFQSQQYKEAWRVYTDALALKIEDDTFNAVLLCNRAAALHCCGQYLDAVVDCCVAAQLDDKYPRVLQRRAEAYMALEDYSSAVADLQRLVQLSTGSKEAATRLKDAQHKLRASGGAGPNYYTVLSLQHGCSAADVKAAYKKLALKHHPDKATGPHAKAAAEAVFVLITAANTVLSDPAKRAAHDAAHLAMRARRCMSSSSSSGAGMHAGTPQHQPQRQRQQPTSSGTSTSSSASSAGMYGSWHQPQPGGFGYAAAAEVAAAKAAAAAAAEAARWRNADSSSAAPQSRYGGSPAAGSSSSSSNTSGASYAFRGRFI